MILETKDPYDIRRQKQMVLDTSMDIESARKFMGSKHIKGEKG